MDTFSWILLIGAIVVASIFFKLVTTNYMCPKCKVKNGVINLNKKPEATLFFAGATPLRRIGNINVNGFLCFQCENFYEFAIWGPDMKNIPGQRIGGLFYFDSYRLTKDLKNQLLSMAKENGIESIINKIEKIKVKG
jgi:hypothetical protein